MRQITLIAWLSGGLLIGCTAGKYQNLNDAPQADRSAAEKTWEEYLKELGSRAVSKNPLLVAKFFSRPLLAHTSEEQLNKHIVACLSRWSAGAFERVRVKALKQEAGGLLLIVDSKAGEAAIPVVREDNQMKFSELLASTGDWAAESQPGPNMMPQKPSLLYIKVILNDEKAPIGERLRAAVMLAESKYRQEIIAQQRKAQNPIVRLGLGLARIKIDGSDESFIQNFPTDMTEISALAQADQAIFEEMTTKLSNLGAMQEDPPANEVLYKVAGGAPPTMRNLMGGALYNMAELSPARFANAVKNIAKDVATDPVLSIYLDEFKRRGSKAPNLLNFLNKFVKIGEPEEKKLCQALLMRITKAR